MVIIIGGGVSACIRVVFFKLGRWYVGRHYEIDLNLVIARRVLYCLNYEQVLRSCLMKYVS